MFPGIEKALKVSVFFCSDMAHGGKTRTRWIAGYVAHGAGNVRTIILTMCTNVGLT